MSIRLNSWRHLRNNSEKDIGLDTAKASIRELIDQASASIPSDSPRLDAELLLAHALGKPRSYLYTWPENQPNAIQARDFLALLARRIKGEPVAYLLGKREFWSLELSVNSAVLIPRPETELLVESILSLPLLNSAAVLDLGTGSGAIALALGSEKPGWRVTAADISADALETAKKNARNLKLRNVEFLLSRWFNAIPDQRYDVIVSNPPYIATADPHLKTGDVRFEPRSALTSGADGLDDLREIVNLAPQHLKIDGYLLVEHGYDQGKTVASLFAARGFTKIRSLRDMEGRSRATLGKNHTKQHP